MAVLTGWVNRPDEVKRILSAKQNPTFKMAAPNLASIWQNEEIGLWAASKAVNGGKHLAAHLQTIGDCVSHGFGRSVDYLFCVKQVNNLVSEKWDEPKTACMTEYIYAVGREAGNDLGPSDGSTGIWQIDGLKHDGYITRDGKSYDGQLAKQYAWRGAPAELKQRGRIHLLEDYAQVEDPQDAANSLKAGNPVAICSNQGFTMTRDANGVCRPTGTWNHCMMVSGLFKVNNAWYFVIEQSWGQNTPSGATPMGGQAPDNSFGCDWNTMGRILGQGDSYSLSGFKNWEPAPTLTWVM